MQRQLILLATITVISACSSVDDNYSTINDWKSYGYNSALSGDKVKSKESLNHLEQPVYKDYLTGYNIGKEKYCAQDAYILGLTFQKYNGICDKSFTSNYYLGLNQIDASWHSERNTINHR